MFEQFSSIQSEICQPRRAFKFLLSGQTASETAPSPTPHYRLFSFSFVGVAPRREGKTWLDSDRAQSVCLVCCGKTSSITSCATSANASQKASQSSVTTWNCPVRKELEENKFKKAVKQGKRRNAAPWFSPLAQVDGSVSVASPAYSGRANHHLSILISQSTDRTRSPQHGDQ